jgi:flagellar biosynthesis regulator FlbT
MRMRAISEEQIAAFQADGYLHLPHCLDESALDATKQALKKVMDKINTFRNEEIYYEDKADPTSLKQIQHLENKDDFFQQLISTGKIYELAQEILQEIFSTLTSHQRLAQQLPHIRMATTSCSSLVGL